MHPNPHTLYAEFYIMISLLRYACVKISIIKEKIESLQLLASNASHCMDFRTYGNFELEPLLKLLKCILKFGVYSDIQHPNKKGRAHIGTLVQLTTPF